MLYTENKNTISQLVKVKTNDSVTDVCTQAVFPPPPPWRVVSSLGDSSRQRLRFVRGGGFKMERPGARNTVESFELAQRRW